jgi:hypothetical protein
LGTKAERGKQKWNMGNERDVWETKANCGDRKPKAAKQTLRSAGVYYATRRRIKQKASTVTMITIDLFRETIASIGLVSVYFYV